MLGTGKTSNARRLGVILPSHAAGCGMINPWGNSVADHFRPVTIREFIVSFVSGIKTLWIIITCDNYGIEAVVLLSVPMAFPVFERVWPVFVNW